MKTAKEHASEFLSPEYKTIEEVNRAITEIANNFIREILELAQQRCISSNEALASIIKEQIQKWHTFARIVNEEAGVDVVKKDGLKDLLILAIPETEQLL